MINYLKNLSFQYINAISQGLEGDVYRMYIHNKFLEKFPFEEDWLKDVLHNLDKYIGLKEKDLFRESKIKYYGNKLYELLMEEFKCLIKEKLQKELEHFEIINEIEWNGMVIPVFEKYRIDELELKEDGVRVIVSIIQGTIYNEETIDFYEKFYNYQEIFNQ